MAANRRTPKDSGASLFLDVERVEATKGGKSRNGQTAATPVARPFVKWAGGKGQLLEQFGDLFPPKFKGYLEPFLGGGAVFFYLSRRLSSGRKKYLSDLNAELINAYQVIRDNVDLLVADLKSHEVSKEHYLNVRALDPKDLSPVSRASRLIFLNRTCFNGLYRVNRKGQFNVPYGKYQNPRICDEVNLSACSAALRGADIRVADFSEAVNRAEKGDFVYLDPPYSPLTKTANFTDYTSQGFDDNDQLRLRDLYLELDKKGCLVMLSNSDVAKVRDWYGKFRVERVDANRYINSKADLRGPIPELVILNYGKNIAKSTSQKRRKSAD